MDRRSFVRLMAAVPFAPSLKGAPGDPATAGALPKLDVVTKYAPARVPGMPGPYPGRVIAVKSEKSGDVETSAANDEVVREMMARGMCALTGKKIDRQWDQPPNGGWSDTSPYPSSADVPAPSPPQIHPRSISRYRFD